MHFQIAREFGHTHDVHSRIHLREAAPRHRCSSYRPTRAAPSPQLKDFWFSRARRSKQVYLHFAWIGSDMNARSRGDMYSCRYEGLHQLAHLRLPAVPFAHQGRHTDAAPSAPYGRRHRRATRLAPDSLPAECARIRSRGTDPRRTLRCRASTSGLSPTHEEFREARDRKPILVFVQEGIEREANQDAFVAEVQAWQSGYFRGGFQTAEELRDVVTRAIHDHQLANATGPLDPP